MPNALDPSALDLDLDVHAPVSGDGAAAPSPGKRSLTQGLAPRSVVIMRVASDADADALAARLGARDGNGVAAGAHHAVDRAASSSGAPLRDDLRERFEHSLGADLSSVRVHTGSTSADASRAVGARAYTVGNDIHFGAGQYAPDDPFGLHLLAHEVAHTLQQAGGAPVRQDKLEVSTPDDPLEREADRTADAMVAGHAAGVSRGAGVQRLARETCGEMIDWWPAQEETPWHGDYDRRLEATKGKGASAEAEFDASRDNGKVKAASAQSKTSTKVKTVVTSDQLQRIVSVAESATAARIAPMAGSMSAAFATMMIDTAQAQADYIAHMAGETGGKLEEVDGDKRSYAPFQGRGPVQVTHPENYARALGILQQRADQVERELKQRAEQIGKLMTERDQAQGADEKQKIEAKITTLRTENDKLREQLVVLHDAIKAIKADPKAAADPKYAFLLSAAHMHQTGAVAATGGLGATADFTGNGAADRWVTGGNNGMTFEQRGVQNEGEIKQLREQAANESDPEARAALEKSIGRRTTLVNDMVSAQARGGVKAKVYAAAMRILTAENAVTPTPEP